ncbi:hypothetical protein PVAP13_3KG052494 [Panicum virgatum]|uniref:Uncharacterized protein n=1 Tax=Panicum virgatum TaxID=38727 RepID=A0A8T0PN45_PANVG|nr:hypothetical protein PVAP13_8KG008941 [Panicum virgatum]KAG2622649.1 hypothetical protein PVAP13_3KG052494 [Panicum virgatum]
MATTTPSPPALLVSSRPYPHRRRHFPADPKPNALPLSRNVTAAYGGDDDIDNEQDYDRLLAPVKPPPPTSTSLHGEEGDIAMAAADSFVSTQDSASDTVDEDEFHKISLLHCNFLIRKVPDPDDDVFDFREMYVTPPDTDIYSIPRVLAPMQQKYVRCTKKDFGRYNVTEPPVEHLRDPLYKTEREIMKVSVPEGKKRDRRNDLLLIRDGGESFRIIDKTKRDDATTIIQREEWAKSRQDVEKHFRKLRDFDYSNWF